MKKILSVPFTRQTTSITCTLASLAMILEYQDKRIAESDINKLVKPMKGGKEYHLADIGRVALSLGFTADLYCYDFTNIFTKDHVGLSQDELKRRFAPWAKSRATSYRMPYLRFMEAGGNLLIQHVSEEQLIDCIDNDTPPILLVECQPFYRLHKKEDCGHAVVLIGYDDDHFYVHDPLRKDKPHAKGKSARIPHTELLFSLYRRYGNTLVLRTL